MQRWRDGDRRAEVPAFRALAAARLYDEVLELYLETVPSDERDHLLSREILTTTVEVNA